jgi:hypothetical protein
VIVLVATAARVDVNSCHSGVTRTNAVIYGWIRSVKIALLADGSSLHDYALVRGS